MIITTERLQYIVSVAQHGSFSGAAKELGVSVAAVNKAIQHLEFDLELTLFERHGGKKPQLTQEGKRLYVKALEILPKLIAMERQAQMMSEGIESQLSICLHPYTCYPEYTRLIGELAARYPDLEINIVEAETLDWQNLQCDIIIAPNRLANLRGVNIQTISRIKWLLVSAPQHPLAQLRSAPELEDFDHHHQLMPPAGNIILPHYLEVMRYSSKLVTVERFYQLRELLLAGCGFAMYPEALAQPLIEEGKLKDLNFDYGKQGNHWPIDLIWQEGLGQAGNWFIEQLIDEE
ncbi:LysR family transcriptional regulator [Shewanella spartinae]|uniref:LysR family transcriptional regulator n=1 Tax=Shewanella spartinae TaxID=2864205 RepID=UPI001C656158|nr:LysR family transcriptional regulator [Shewanella spartinae]QYJ94459.1 LysR family transcriptional regulator [Shewanella spartinae]